MNRRWHDFRDLADKGSYDVYQPDTVLCGGFTRTKKIADYVQSKGAVFLSPHMVQWPWAFWLTFIWPVLSATRNTWNTH